MIEAHAKRLSFDQDKMWVHLADGRTLGVPLNFFPRLSQATSVQREGYVLSGGGQGLHWEALDEDISVEHLLMGHGDTTIRRPPSKTKLG
jgi:hypothetical protein